MIDKHYNKIIISLPFIAYTFIGCYLSLTNGISHDEFHEQLNWEVNFSAIKQFFKDGTYENLLVYSDKNYGIAFHFISQPIQFLLKDFVGYINNVSEYGSILISKHLVVFLVFNISGLFFYLICFKITQQKFFSICATFFYLITPYLFGHAQFNVKDIPFLSFWLLNTYLSLRIFENLQDGKKINNKILILLGFFSAFLVSIRIVGFIIFLQYLITLLIYIEKNDVSFFGFLKKNYNNLLIFFSTFFLFVFILNPILWHNPLVIIDSFLEMSKYHKKICTLTNGYCIDSQNVPSSYYLIWFFYKLPIIILIGYALFPFVEEKIFKDKTRSIYYGTLTIFVPVLLVIFILINITIYDELRHILFVFPLLFLTSLSNLYFFFNDKFLNVLKKNFLSYIVLTISFFFVLENYSLNSYQYTWMNSFAKFKDIEKKFEIDYLGLSNKALQKKIIEHVNKNKISKNICIYGDGFVKEFLIKENFSCFKNYSEVDAAKIKPFFAYKNLRNVKRSNPKDCSLVWDENYKYIFTSKQISVGSLWYCN